MISVILSIFNESNNPLFKKIIAQFQQYSFFELVFIDGGSTDGTLDFLNENKLTYFSLPGSTRGARLKLGLSQAKYDAVLLHHPRSMIECAGLDYLIEHAASMDWLAFKHKFDHPHWFLRYVSWYSNTLRVKRKKIVYLDHCMFFNKNLLEGLALPELAIFEDTALSELLNKQHTPYLLPYVSTTSAIRFLDRGIFKQFLLNQFLKCAYKLSFNHKWMNRLYEKQLNLNQDN